MEIKCPPIDEVRSKLDRLREDPTTQRKFPQELWDSVIQLTKIYSFEEVCRRLRINPIYLKRKIGQSDEPALKFCEITLPTAQVAFDTVTIELRSPDGLQAKIQGPVSCLNYFSQILGR